MKGFLIVAALVTVAAAQYDYTPPRRTFNAGGNKDTYGPPNHTPGAPVTAPTPAFSRPEAQAQPQAPVEDSDSGYNFGSSDSDSDSGTSFPSSGPSSFPQEQPQSQPQPQEQEAYGPVEYKPQVFRHVYVHAAPDEPEERQSRTIRVPGGDKHVNIIFVRAPSSSSSHQTEVILPEQDEHKSLVYVLLKKGTSTSDVKIRRPAAQAPKKPEVYFIRYGDKASQGGYQGQGGQSGQSGQESSSNGNGSGYQPQPQRQQQHQAGSAGGYREDQRNFRVPAPIRRPEDVPSSGYGVPL